MQYEQEKTYNIQNITVLSKVVRDWVDEAKGTRHVVIESSCKSERWETRKQDHSLTTPKEYREFAVALERARTDAAEAIARVERMGDEQCPKANLLGIEIEHHGNKRLRAVASLTTATPYTLMPSGMIRALEIPATGQYHYERQGTTVASIPVYHALIHFDDLAIDTLIVPSEHNGPMVVGGQFLQVAFNQRRADLIQLLLPDHLQSLSSAARSKKSTVLLLGKYGSHRGRLDSIKRVLHAKGLNGIVLDEYPDIEEQDLPEKMLTFASISKFVLVDDIAPSGHIHEFKICQEMRFITALLRCNGRPSTMMQADIAAEVLYIKEFSYDSELDLEGTVGTAADWADSAIIERSRRLNRLFAEWRSPDRIMR